MNNDGNKEESTSNPNEGNGTGSGARAETPKPQPRTELAGIALSMRIPKFWRDRVRLWFITFEAVTAETKRGEKELAQMVIAQLEKQDIEQIADLLYIPFYTIPFHLFIILLFEFLAVSILLPKVQPAAKVAKVIT